MTFAPKGSTFLETSVVVISHNNGRYLAECLESVLAQTRPAKEVLVIGEVGGGNRCAGPYGSLLPNPVVDVVGDKRRPHPAEVADAGTACKRDAEQRSDR